MKTKRIIALILVMILSTSCFIACKKEEKKELNILTWEGYFPQELLDEFQDEYNVTINYANMTSNEEMLAKLETNKGEYDLILASDYIIKMAIDEGLVSKLDKDKLSNYKNISSDYQGFYYDENSEYTVPYAPGIPYLVYDPEKVNVDIEGYEDLWDESLKDSLCIMDNERVVLGMVLKMQGESFNTENKDKLEKAANKLYELAPNIRVIDGNFAHQYLLDGEVSVAYLYTSAAILALNTNPNLKVVAPKEGLGFGVDAFFIPDGAPNKDVAHEFLNFMMDGENAAKAVQYTCYLNPNQAAVPYLEDWYKKATDKMTVDKKNGEFIENVNNETNDIHGKIWEEFLKRVN